MSWGGLLLWAAEFCVCGDVAGLVKIFSSCIISENEGRCLGSLPYPYHPPTQYSCHNTAVELLMGQPQLFMATTDLLFQDGLVQSHFFQLQDTTTSCIDRRKHELSRHRKNIHESIHAPTCLNNVSNCWIHVIRNGKPSVLEANSTYNLKPICIHE